MSSLLTAPEPILTVLRNATLDSAGLTLPGQLDRKSYESVAKFLEASGVKWNKKAKRHLFETPTAGEKFAAFLSTGAVRDDKKHFQAFYTPVDVIERMLFLASIEPGHHVLEPSAGDSRIVRAVKIQVPTAYIVSIEIDESKNLDDATEFFTGDFLTFEPQHIGTYDRILMNPPFTGGQDIKHILHAQRFLRDNGKLVAICADGPKQQDAFRDASIYESLPDASFKESGTQVKTAIVLLETL